MNRKTQQIDISVVVPTYDRSEILEDLIHSYTLQTHTNSELVIIDDYVQDNKTRRMVMKYSKNDKRIRFIKNKKNLGYSKNFLKTITAAQGKYLLILGDDDILIGENVLSRYVSIFDSNPNVGFIYSNILQFNSNFEMDFVYEHFKKDIHFKTQEESLQNIWLKSCYIPGIGLRNNVDFKKLYPKTDMLFPQVELIGKIIAKTQSYGISEYLIGGRAHNEQLGFEAVKGKRIKNNEKHSSIELIDIYKKIEKYFSDNKIKLNLNDSFVKNFFINSHASTLPTEKINTGNKNLFFIFINAVKKNNEILLSVRYMSYMIISLILPSQVLILLKNIVKNHLVSNKWENEQKYFRTNTDKIRNKKSSTFEAISKEYSFSGERYEFGSISTIRRMIGKNKLVLDIGCSYGYLGANNKSNNTYYGIDGNKQAADVAIKKYKKVMVQDLNKIPEKDIFTEKFDVIVFADILEHLLYPEEILNHFKGYLKKNGTIIISVPNVALWRVRLNLFFGKFDYTDYGVLDRTHLHLYTFKSASKLINSINLKINKRVGAAYLLGRIISLLPFTQPLFSVHVIIEASLND